MRICVSEFLCGGGWPEPVFPVSLLREGRAMLETLVDDLVRLPGVHVVTTWDMRLPRTALSARHNVDIWPVESADCERSTVRTLVNQSDAVLVIAPETGGVLEDRCRQVAEYRVANCNASPTAIALCADKLRLYEFCRRHGIPTIPTSVPAEVPHRGRIVVKPRDGAGSAGMHCIDSRNSTLEELATLPRENWIVQPYIAGRSLSVAAIFEFGRLQHLLPVAEQRLVDDGTFRYLGGRIPARIGCVDEIEKLVQRVSRHLDGLHGYIGFDLLIPDESPSAPLLVEINPRLTTSYVGYRRLCTANLAQWLIPGWTKDVPRFAGSVEFLADGRLVEQVSLKAHP